MANEGFFLNVDGEYQEIGVFDTMSVEELDHTEYGVIEYILFNEVYYALSWVPDEDNPFVPADWIGEIGE